jgi:hypothetical protein
MARAVMSVMDSRMCFIAGCLRREAPVSVLCERYGISRKTGGKWLARYRTGGVLNCRTDRGHTTRSRR